MCDRIVVINKGRIVADDNAESLAKNLSADHKLVIHAEGSDSEIKKLLEAIPQVQRVFVNRKVEENVNEYYLEAKEGYDVRREVFKKLAGRNYPILMMRSNELTLEEVFLKLTTGDVYGGAEKIEAKFDRMSKEGNV